MIAVDTALRPCLAAGITPDLVVAVDPGLPNLSHLQVAPLAERAWIVADPSVAPGSFAAFDGRVFTFRVDRHHPWPWLQALGVDRSRLRAWGSVLLTALDLAEKLGSRPIALLGADFAYTDGQPYCRGTVYEEDWDRRVRKGEHLREVWNGMKRPPLITQTALDGAPVETSAVLLAFRDRIEQHCRSRPEGTFLNLTGRGLLRGFDGDLSAIPDATCNVPEVLRAAAGALVPTRLTRDAALASLRAGEEQPWADWAATAEGPLAVLVEALATAFPEADAAFHQAYRTLKGRPWGYPSAGAPAPSAPRPGPTRHFAIHETPIPAELLDLRTERWQRINRRRLEHLASLRLPVEGRNVLELGPGIGDLTDFFLERGCAVTAVDGRAEMLEVMRARFAGHPAPSSSRARGSPYRTPRFSERV